MFTPNDLRKELRLPNLSSIRYCFFLLVCLAFFQIGFSQDIVPGHSHNDYEHPNPLLGALESGIRSIEIDVFLKGDELIVSHIPVLLGIKPTLTNQYLIPLEKLISQNGGTVFPGDSTPLILYIDFKTRGGTYEKLRETLLPFWDLLTLRDSVSTIWGPIQILIDHYENEVMAENPRWTQIQKGWDQWDIGLSAGDCPRLSGSFRSIFSWRGRGEMPETEFQKLKAIADSAHAYGRTVRLYAAGNKPKVWETLLNAGIDWINVDRCRRFREFYLDWASKSAGLKENQTIR